MSDDPKTQDPAPLTDELDAILAEIDEVLDEALERGESEAQTEDGDDG